MSEPEVFTILPAEFLGDAIEKDGMLNVGGLEVPIGEWWSDHKIGVYVRRMSNDLSIVEVCMTRHDGLAQEELDAQNEEAERYPLGPKEYWRSEMVGKYTVNGHPMTDEEFEEDWENPVSDEK